MKTSTLIIAFFIIISGLTILNGCSANLKWFVRNLSNKEVILILSYEHTLRQNGNSFIPLKVKYVNFKNEILKIDYKTSKLLNDSLRVEAIDSLKYELIIPRQSTVDLTLIVPTDFGRHTNVVAEFKQDDRINSINTTSIFDNHKQFKMTGGLTLKNLVYYDYGKKSYR